MGSTCPSPRDPQARRLGIHLPVAMGSNRHPLGTGRGETHANLAFFRSALSAGNKSAICSYVIPSQDPAYISSKLRNTCIAGKQRADAIAAARETSSVRTCSVCACMRRACKVRACGRSQVACFGGGPLACLRTHLHPFNSFGPGSRRVGNVARGQDRSLQRRSPQACEDRSPIRQVHDILLGPRAKRQGICAYVAPVGSDWAPPFSQTQKRQWRRVGAIWVVGEGSQCRGIR